MACVSIVSFLLLSGVRCVYYNMYIHLLIDSVLFPALGDCELSCYKQLSSSVQDFV